MHLLHNNGDGVGVTNGISESQDVLLERGCVLLLLHLATKTMVDSVQDVVDSDAGLVGWLGTFLVDTSLDEDTVPVIVGNLVDSIGTTDVALRSVADEVDG